MDPSELPATHCYSMRLVRPFTKLLRRYESFPVAVLDSLDAMDPDERIPITGMMELLRGAIVMTNDPDLGLKAAHEIEMGDYGALEYAASSAATMREALQVAIRYPRLVNDALSVTLDVEGDKAMVRLHSTIVLSRANNDFQSAAFYVALTVHKVLGVQPSYEVWFTHPRPESTLEYARTFPGAAVHFGMPSNAFVFDAVSLELPLATADSKLHAVIRRHAEVLLAQLPRAQSFTESVRVLLARELAGGDPGVAHVAKALHMSSRTLARRLESEGTTFKDLVDDLRKRLSLGYVSGHELDISEVAFLLGFSDSSSFYRAFKRWTGQTPLAYRRGERT